MARKTGRRTARCPLGVNGGEYPHWSIAAVHGDDRRVLRRAGGNVVCLPVGTGAVNWTGLIARFQQDGYRGPVSLEPHLLPREMAAAMEADATFLRRAGWVR